MKTPPPGFDTARLPPNLRGTVETAGVWGGNALAAAWQIHEDDLQIAAAKTRIAEVRAAQTTEREQILAEQVRLAERLRALDKEIAPLSDEYGDLLKKRFMASEYARQPGEGSAVYQARLAGLRVRDRAAGRYQDG